jgi:hypothetical protein
MRTSLMARPTGSSSSRISSRTDEISYSADTPPVVHLSGVALGRAHHFLRPWLIPAPEDRTSYQNAAAGRVHSGIEWISVSPSTFSGVGPTRQRLIHNARPLMVMRPRQFPVEPDVMTKLAINDTDFILEAPFPGIHIPVDGRYFPPGSLQIVVDENERQVIDSFTTLPTPVEVPMVPCSGWCRKQHIYTHNGLDEMAVVFFDRNGWPIACRENLHDKHWTRTGVKWWRYDYSRPEPDFMRPD